MTDFLVHLIGISWAILAIAMMAVIIIGVWSDADRSD